MEKCAVLKFEMYCLQSTKANGIRTLFEAEEKNIAILHGSVLCDVLGGYIMSHIVVFAKMWNTKKRSLKAKLFNPVKQDQDQYIS